jgi:heterogeneous nuclear rnp K-like protein 2
MSDNENNGGSPIDRSKRPRFEDEEWDSDYERDGHEDRHPKRLAVPDPETKAPHFIPSAEETNNNNKEHASEKPSSRRKKWEEQESEDELDDKPRHEAIKAEPSDSQEEQSQGNDFRGQVAIRSLVGTKDAGVIIGRGGKNVSDIRELSSARVTISEIVPGAYERILTVSGPIQAVAKVNA